MNPLKIIIGAAAIVLIASSGVFSIMKWHAAHTVVSGASSATSSASSLEKNFPDAASTLRDIRDRWEKRIHEVGAENAYAEFLKEAPTLSVSTHAQAHAFGEALYDIEGLDGLKVCDSSFAYGCYHSFFGLAVHDQGIGALPKFDEACSKKFGADNLPCQHGIGHGILVYTNYDLEKALELCEIITVRPTGGCSSGVFMEYNFHSMDENGDGSYMRQKTDDLLAPCSTLPDRFQPSCYYEQPQWWLSVLNKDFTQMGKLCGTLPKDSSVYDACYNGTGNYVAASVDSDYKQIIPLCALMPDESTRGLCNEGASWLVRADKTKLDDAGKLCDALQEPYKTRCFQKLQF